jgi:hypothetical protein
LVRPASSSNISTASFDFSQCFALSQLIFGPACAFSLWGGTEPGASCPLMWQKQRAFLPQRSHHAPWVVGPLGFGPEAQSRRALAARKTGLSKARASIANTCAGKSSLGGQRERHVGGRFCAR